MAAWASEAHEAVARASTRSLTLPSSRTCVAAAPTVHARPEPAIGHDTGAPHEADVQDPLRPNHLTYTQEEAGCNSIESWGGELLFRRGLAAIVKGDGADGEGDRTDGDGFGNEENEKSCRVG